MMRRMLFTGIVLACLAGSAAAADVMFGYKFTPGKSERYRLKLNTEVTTAGMDVSQKADMTVKVTCSSGAKGSYAMSLLFEKVAKLLGPRDAVRRKIPLPGGESSEPLGPLELLAASRERVQGPRGVHHEREALLPHHPVRSVGPDVRRSRLIGESDRLR